MPIQAPQWTEFLSCPVCCNEFDVSLRSPISLGCGHTICKACLSNLHRKQCPFDQTTINTDIENLPTNYALLQLVGATVPTEEVDCKVISKECLQKYLQSKKCIEELALYLKPFSSVGNVGGSSTLLSRPMQRKLVTLINCQLVEEEGRSRAMRAARSLGERTVTELILQHQNPQQLSANLWAGVRARGCQFLGPAMQEEVLRLVLLALEDGSALSRKVLVMFVVQRLEPHFPQASKTSIGHVVQLLYRASCFKVSKRDGDSSLMQLKEEFRTYEALRREHDAQVVQIATEAGLRIAPDQWSALLYGDAAHKSHMQSIIDKLQTPQSFAQSAQELMIALQRTGDPGGLAALRPHLELLAAIDPGAESPPPSWDELAGALTAVNAVVVGLMEFVQQHGNRRPSETGPHSHAAKYKISMCRDLTLRGSCPRGPNCTFAHSEEELEKYRAKNRKTVTRNSSSRESRSDGAPAIQQVTDVAPYVPTDDILYSGTNTQALSPATIQSTVPPALPHHIAYDCPAFPTPPPMTGAAIVNQIQQSAPLYQQSSPSYQQTSPPYQQTSPSFQQTSPPFQQTSPSFQQTSPFQQPQQIFPQTTSTFAPDIYTAAPHHNMILNPRQLCYSQGEFNSCTQRQMEGVSQPPPLQPIPTVPIQNQVMKRPNWDQFINQKHPPNMQHNVGLQPTIKMKNNKYLAALHQRKQEIINQLAKVVGKNAATAISNSSSNHARINSMPLNESESPFPILTSTVSGPTFVRSDSILMDDEYVPYESPTTDSKYGPISRMSKSPTHLVQMSNDGIPMSRRSVPSLNSQSSWYINNNGTGAQPIITSSTPSGYDTTYIGMGPGSSPSQLYIECQSEDIKQQILNLERQLNDLRIYTRKEALSEKQRLTQELQLIERGIFEKEKEVQLNQISSSCDINSADEDTYEASISHDMRELELRLQTELEEQEKRWSSEDDCVVTK